MEVLFNGNPIRRNKPGTPNYIVCFAQVSYCPKVDPVTLRHRGIVICKEDNIMIEYVDKGRNWEELVNLTCQFCDDPSRMSPVDKEQRVDPAAVEQMAINVLNSTPQNCNLSRQVRDICLLFISLILRYLSRTKWDVPCCILLSCFDANVSCISQ